MQYRVLGRTGLRVSAIGFGGIPIQRCSAAEAERIVRRAAELGVNFFDTARKYLDSELKIGQALKSCRKEVFLASKSPELTAEGIRKDLEAGLKNLGTDCLDLYQLHNVRGEKKLQTALGPGGALEGLLKAREEGKVRFIGITSHYPATLLKAAPTGFFDTLQFPYNYLEREAEAELLPLAGRLGLGTIIMKPLAGGAFKNAAPALKYLLQQPVSVLIPGPGSPEEAVANCLVGENPVPPTEEEISQLEREAKLIGGTFCRRCDYCQPCPNNLNISMIFNLHAYYTRYGLVEKSSRNYRSMKANYEQCEQCGECEAKCPYHLPIRKMLKEAHATFTST